MSKSYVLVMAGGRGTRLWPESTQNKPKQYLNLVGENSLLSQTLSRFDGIVNENERFIVTTEDQKELAISTSLEQITPANFIYEPAGRNTAPCILLSIAAIEAAGATDDDVIAVMPSDHVILDVNSFKETYAKSVELCRTSNTITTIGIKPNFPHTGYGYIKTGDQIDSGLNVEEFVEKPNFETAKTYLATGRYLWNAGMFMATLGTFKREFNLHSQDMFKYYSDLLDSINNKSELAEVYNKLPKDSIDYAIMEKSNSVTTVPATFDWNDLGSWEALESVVKQEQDNTIINADSVFTKDATGNIIYAPEKFVSLVNVNDLVVVSNEKSVMVMPKKDSQRVKEVVEHLKTTGKSELL